MRLRIRKAAVVLTAAFCLGSPAAARAHDPGLSSLELRVDPERIVATLAVAAVDARVPLTLESIELRLDDVPLPAAVRTRAIGETGSSIVVVFERLAGSRLTVRSNVPTQLALGHRELLTIRRADGALLAERMLDARSHEASIDLDVAPRGTAVALRFLDLGIRHIVGGYDHLLFLAALLLGVCRMRDVVRTVTAFTVAHSLTLALAVLGLVHAPSMIVEPMIAASIVWVGFENLLRQQTAARWKLTFAFGLVHGLGFAGALQDLGIGSSRGAGIAIPLGSFNLGVEVGQIGVAMLLWPLVSHLNARPSLRVRLAPMCSLFVIAAGTYWLVQRTFF